MSDARTSSLVAEAMAAAHQYIFKMEWRDDEAHKRAIEICGALTKAIHALPDQTKGNAACDCAPDGNGWMRPCPDKPANRYCILAHTPCEHCTEPTQAELRDKRGAVKTGAEHGS